MNDATTKQSTEKIRQWFHAIGNRIDRISLGTALAVAGLTWMLFGMQYIAFFLVGYFYTFLFFSRKKIVSNYPPNGDSIIRFVYSCPYIQTTVGTRTEIVGGAGFYRTHLTISGPMARGGFFAPPTAKSAD